MNRYATSYRSSYGRVPARRVAPPPVSADSPTQARPSFWTSLLARLLRATSERASTLFRWMFGEENGLTIGSYCSICDDVHADGYRCPRALEGTCLDCRRHRTLNRFGLCPAGHSSIVNRRLKWPDAHRYNAALTKGKPEVLA